MSFTKTEGGVLIDGPASTHLARLMVLGSALSLEIKLKGFKVTRGRTAYSILKREYGLKGTREKVLAQVERMVDAARVNPGAQEVQ